jgi:hypothetical protein
LLCKRGVPRIYPINPCQRRFYSFSIQEKVSGCHKTTKPESIAQSTRTKSFSPTSSGAGPSLPLDCLGVALKILNLSSLDQRKSIIVIDYERKFLEDLSKAKKKHYYR